MSPFSLVLILCAIAVIALIINKFKKLPKFVFLFLAVSIVVGVCWYSMAPEPQKNAKSSASSDAPVLFVKAAQDVFVSSGETRFSLPILDSSENKLDCIRFRFRSDADDLTEQAFVQNVKFSLLFSDGLMIPAESIIFEKEKGASFPREFILKVFFTSPKGLGHENICCIAENRLPIVFKVPEISVGAYPLSENE